MDQVGKGGTMKKGCKQNVEELKDYVNSDHWSVTHLCHVMRYIT